MFDGQQLHVIAAGRVYDARRGHGERLQPGRRGHGRHEPGGQQDGHQHGGRDDAAPEHQHGYDDEHGAPGATVGRRPTMVMMVMMLLLLLVLLMILKLVVVVLVLFILVVLLTAVVGRERWRRFVLTAGHGRRTVVRLRQYRVLELGRRVTGPVLGAHRLEHRPADTPAPRADPI